MKIMNIVKYFNPVKEIEGNTVKVIDGVKQFKDDGTPIMEWVTVRDEKTGKPIYRDSLTVKFEFDKDREIPKTIGIDMLTQMSEEFSSHKNGEKMNIKPDTVYHLKNYSKKPYVDSEDRELINGYYSPYSSYTTKLSFNKQSLKTNRKGEYIRIPLF